MLNILIVDDEEVYRKEIGEFLKKKKFEIFFADRPSKAKEILKDNEIDIVILDANLPELNGLDFLSEIKKDYADTEVIIITGFGDMNSVIKALRNGASDFFTKPFSLLDIYAAIERTQKYIKLENKLKYMENAFNRLTDNIFKDSYTNFIGKSKAIKKVFQAIKQVAKTYNTSVMIIGETGTGKELVARGIHYLSDRKKNIFYPVNCAAIPDEIFESEFFGYKKGAFTGAFINKPGILEISHGGTLFLDEVTELTLRQQGKLLRTLEDRIVRRIGSHREFFFDVRIVSATNEDISALLEKGNLREDFYYRLNSFEIKIPPLRERKEDIPLLVDYFVEQYQKILRHPIRKIEDSVYTTLTKYDFPGNIRELRNIIEKAIIISQDNILRKEDISFNTQRSETKNKIYDLEELEKTTILEVLKMTNFKKSKAAKILNISRQALDRRLEKYGIKIPD